MFESSSEHTDAILLAAYIRMVNFVIYRFHTLYCIYLMSGVMFSYCARSTESGVSTTYSRIW